MKKSFLAFFLMCGLSASAQFSNGAFLLSEGMYGTSSGDLFWFQDLNADTEMTAVYGDINGFTFGETPEFATFYGGKLYVSSKQKGYYNNGGVLSVADAASLQHIHSFTSLGDDGHNYDGRMFLGISPTKGYMGTSNGVFVINLENNQVVKFINGTECGYEVGESVDEWGVYQYDVYYHQIGSMLRAGDYVFVSQQNRGIHIVDADTDEILYTIDADIYGGSFGDLVQSRDGNVWTSVCTTENYQWNHTPELNQLVKINPYTWEVEVIEVENKVSVSWDSWRTPMMQAAKSDNRIYWRKAVETDSFTSELLEEPAICYYDIDKQEEGVFVELPYNAYAGFSLDPETGYIYVPVAEGNFWGPWYLYVYDEKGDEVTSMNIPIGDWSDYPAIVFFTDDYAPEFNLDEEYTLDVNETLSFKISDIVSDKDNLDVSIVVKVANVENSEIAMAEVVDGVLNITMKGIGVSSITFEADSNGKIATHTINVIDSYTTAIENVNNENYHPIEYYNLQGVKVEKPENGIFFKKQGTHTTKVVF